MAEQEDGVIFGKVAAQQIAKTVREVSRRMMNEKPHRARWQQHPGGGGESMWFTIVEALCPDGYTVTREASPQDSMSNL